MGTFGTTIRAGKVAPSAGIMFTNLIKEREGEGGRGKGEEGEKTQQSATGKIMPPWMVRSSLCSALDSHGLHVTNAWPHGSMPR